LGTHADARQPRLYDQHLHKWLHRIDVPTLLLWGADDKTVPIARSVEFTSRIPGSRSVVIPACGHSPHVERLDAYVEAVTRFIKA
jgi:pimeloyl-ACP methyl ester carboxylesterase